MITKLKKAFMYGYAAVQGEKNLEYRLADRQLSKRLSNVIATLDKLPGGASVLNLGCGDGSLEIHTSKHRAYAFTSIDIEPDAIEKLGYVFANSSNQHDKAVIGDITKLHNLVQFNSQYDAVVSWRVLHGIAPEFYDTIFKDIKASIKPGSSFFISVACDRDWKVKKLNGEYDPHGVNDCATVMFHDYGIMRTHPFPVHFFSLEELVKLGEDNGFILKELDTFQEPSGYTHLQHKMNSYLYAHFIAE